MRILKKILIAVAIVAVVLAVAGWWLTRGDTSDIPIDQVTGEDPRLDEPNPETIPTVNIAKPVGWKDDEAPVAAQGLVVNRFAVGLDHPRNLLTLPNGDVLVTETNAPERAMGGGNWLSNLVARILFSRAGAGGPSPNRLVLLRDENGDGMAEAKKVLRTDLDSPAGMAWANDKLYIANHDEVLEFPYTLGSETLSGNGRKLMDLPPAGNHWSRNLALRPDGAKLYVAVGSASNIGEGGMEIEQGRAAIHEIDLATGKSRLFAGGLRNPNGLDFNPWTGELWTTVNERDMLGSDLVPDYLTNVPVGAQYGWPWVYWRDNFDERVPRDNPPPNFLTEYTRRPEYAMGPHVAALGLVFTGEGNRMGSPFAQGAFVARHGSWNRKPAAGYDVVFVKFDARGNPTGKPIAVLTGFLNDNGTTKGRPAWLAWDKTGGLLVSDDTAGIVWRVIAPNAAPNAAPQKNTGERMPAVKRLEGDPNDPLRHIDKLRQD